MRRAFTLIELLVCLVLLALIAAVAAISVRGPYQSLRLDEALERIVASDSLMREHARRFNASAELQFDLDAGILSVVELRPEAKQPRTLILSGVVRIDRLYTPAKRVDYGRPSVRCSGEGQTPTYAIRVCAPNGRRTWLMFAGISGEVLRTEEDHEIQAIFAHLATQGTGNF